MEKENIGTGVIVRVASEGVYQGRNILLSLQGQSMRRTVERAVRALRNPLTKLGGGTEDRLDLIERWSSLTV